MSSAAHLTELLERWEKERNHPTADRAALTQDLLDELQLHWEERRNAGQPVTPESLCGQCPELLPELDRRIQRLQAFKGAFPSAPMEENGTGKTPPAPSEPVTAVTRYGSLRYHARGGLGEVFVGTDEQSGRPVAVKFIQRRWATNRKHCSRFSLERQLTSRLEHPSIVPVYGSGEGGDGRPFYVMRYIKGKTLAEAIREFHEPPEPRGKAPEQGLHRTPEPRRKGREQALVFRTLLGHLVTVCQTVAYAHSRGVLHRDLKPHNIMIGAYGEVMVMDWGLAKPFCLPEPPDDSTEALVQPAADPDAVETERNRGIGTRGYMSPEQEAGEWERVGPASDVYSLGAILHVLLTGNLPSDPLGAEGKSRLREFAVPRALEAICRKAMARQPEDRYASPLALAGELERWLADEPVTSYREPYLTRAARWVRRHRTVVTSTGVALALLLAGAVGGLLLWESAKQKQREQAQEYRIQARTSGEADEWLALAEVAADRLASAERILKQACERLLDQPQLDDLRARLEARRDRVGRLVRFYHLADQVERRTYFKQLREARAAAEQGLAALDIAADPSWRDHLPDAELTSEQIDKLKNDAHRLLLLAGGLRALDGFMRFGAPEAAQDFHAAIRAFDQAEQHRASRAGSYMRLFCRFGLGQRDHLKALPDGEPTSDVDHYLMGLAHLAMMKNPDNPVVKLLLARLRPLLQDLDFKTPGATAEKHLRRAVELNPRHFFYHLFLGRALRETNQFQSAELAWNTCVALRPDGALGYHMRAEALSGQYWISTDPIRKDYLIKRILEDRSEVIRLEPTAESFSKRGGTLVVKGDLDKAIEDYNEAIRRDPGQHQFYGSRGYAYYQKRELDQAITNFVKAIELDPGDAEAYENRGRAWKDKGDEKRAEADFAKVRELKAKKK
jgi:tetratricopeptide (TPR) repeat protein